MKAKKKVKCKRCEKTIEEDLAITMKHGWMKFFNPFSPVVSYLCREHKEERQQFIDSYEN